MNFSHPIMNEMHFSAICSPLYSNYLHKQKGQEPFVGEWFTGVNEYTGAPHSVYVLLNSSSIYRDLLSSKIKKKLKAFLSGDASTDYYLQIKTESPKDFVNDKNIFTVEKLREISGNTWVISTSRQFLYFSISFTIQNCQKLAHYFNTHSWHIVDPSWLSSSVRS